LCEVLDIERLTDSLDIEDNEATEEPLSGRINRLQRDETKQTLGLTREWEGE
jgi:hypothetical protein